jgi:hypothetical protein
MAKRPEKRYQTFEALRLELESLLLQMYGAVHAVPEIRTDKLADLINWACFESACKEVETFG